MPVTIAANVEPWPFGIVPVWAIWPSTHIQISLNDTRIYEPTDTETEYLYNTLDNSSTPQNILLVGEFVWPMDDYRYGHSEQNGTNRKRYGCSTIEDPNLDAEFTCITLEMPPWRISSCAIHRLFIEQHIIMFKYKQKKSPLFDFVFQYPNNVAKNNHWIFCNEQKTIPLFPK